MAEFAGSTIDWCRMHARGRRALGFSGTDIGETVKWQMEEGRGNHESGLHGSDKGSEQS